MEVWIELDEILQSMRVEYVMRGYGYRMTESSAILKFFMQLPQSSQRHSISYHWIINVHTYGDAITPAAFVVIVELTPAQARCCCSTARCTTSFHPPFGEIYAHSISLNHHQLYIVIVANGCGCTQKPFWLPGKIVLQPIPCNAIVHRVSGPCGTTNSDIRVYCL